MTWTIEGARTAARARRRCPVCARRIRPSNLARHLALHRRKAGEPLSDRPILVVVEPTGWQAGVDEPEQAIRLAEELLALARAEGHRSPYARFYGAGRLVRDRVTRTDLATSLGRCWCGRGNLYGYPRPGEAFCCAAHEALWGKMSRPQRARVIVARFVSIYGRR